MAKRAWYLKPGAVFAEFWEDLNYVERRRYMAQRTVPTRWRPINRAADLWGYWAAQENPKASKNASWVVDYAIKKAQQGRLVPMFLMGKE